MVKQSEYEYTLRFREAIKKLIIEQVDKIRPPYRYGTCNSVDLVTRKVSVTIVGDTVPVTVKLGSLIPLPGQIVRVEGYVGDRFVADILAGVVPSGVLSVQPGTNVTVDDTDPQNPIVSALGGIVLVTHGTDGTVARPDATVVYWIGSATPTNAIFYDFWFNGDPV